MKNKSYLLYALLIALFTGGCQKMDRPVLGNYVKDANPPGGPLKFYTAFDGVDVDSIRANFAIDNPLSFVAGITGKAVKGVDNKAIVYPSANDFKVVTSFSLAFWIKNTAQVGRTEFLFSLVDNTYGWHNSALFLLMENQTAAKTTMKLGLMDQWLEGDFQKPVFDGNWHQIVYVYDQVSSKMTYYFDGAAVSGMTARQTDVKKAGSERGAVDFSKANKLIIGGWNKHGSATGPTDDWIKSFTGSLDQFRLYGKALSATEVTSLYNSKL